MNLIINQAEGEIYDQLVIGEVQEVTQQLPEVIVAYMECRDRVGMKESQDP